MRIALVIAMAALLTSAAPLPAQIDPSPNDRSTDPVPIFLARDCDLVIEGRVASVAPTNRNKRGGCIPPETHSLPMFKLFDLDLAVTKLWAGTGVGDTCHVSSMFVGTDFDAGRLAVGKTVLAWCWYDCADHDRLGCFYALYDSSTGLYVYRSNVGSDGFFRNSLSSASVQQAFAALTENVTGLTSLAAFTVGSVEYSAAWPTHVGIVAARSWIVGGAPSPLPTRLAFEDQHHCFWGINHGDTLVVALRPHSIQDSTYSTTRCLEDLRFERGYARRWGKFADLQRELVEDKATHLYSLVRGSPR
jgi:hypothetical protein